MCGRWRRKEQEGEGKSEKGAMGQKELGSKKGGETVRGFRAKWTLMFLRGEIDEKLIGRQ